jgi:uncharacterized protein YbjT (DUF2867 family)
MRLIVTGSTGFVGSRLLPLLVQEGFQIRCLVRRPEACGLLEAQGCKAVMGDLSNPESLFGAFQGCDMLINVASLGFGHAPAIVAAAATAGVRRALFVSTTAIFTNLNAKSKAVRVAAEETIRNSGLRWTILRPTMIYGSARDRNMFRLVRLLRWSPVLPVFGTGKGLMQPVHVDDVAKAIIDVLRVECTVGRAYNIAGAAPLTYNEVIRTTARLLRRRVLLLHLPHRLVISLAAALERRGISLPLKAEQLLRLNENKDFSWTDAAEDFGYAPRDFAAGMSQEITELEQKVNSL